MRCQGCERYPGNCPMCDRSDEPEGTEITPSRDLDAAARWGWDEGELAAMKHQARQDGGW